MIMRRNDNTQGLNHMPWSSGSGTENEIYPEPPRTVAVQWSQKLV
jgi:environmental stress-induced protein Ves